MDTRGEVPSENLGQYRDLTGRLDRSFENLSPDDQAKLLQTLKPFVDKAEQNGDKAIPLPEGGQEISDIVSGTAASGVALSQTDGNAGRESIKTKVTDYEALFRQYWIDPDEKRFEYVIESAEPYKPSPDCPVEIGAVKVHRKYKDENGKDKSISESYYNLFLVLNEQADDGVELPDYLWFISLFDIDGSAEMKERIKKLWRENPEIRYVKNWKMIKPVVPPFSLNSLNDDNCWAILQKPSTAKGKVRYIGPLDEQVE